MRLEEFDAVLDEVIDGRTDTRWLRQEIERLTALRDQLPEADRDTADWTLGELRDHLDADEADAARQVAVDDPLQQAVRLRHGAEAGAQDLSPAEQVERMEKALERIGELIDAESDDDVRNAILDEAGLLSRQAAVKRHLAGMPPRELPGQSWSVNDTSVPELS
jgi:site-specific recombinase